MNIEPYLEQHKAALIAELSGFMHRPLPDEVRCVEVMLFREAMPSVPFRVFFLNRFKGPAKTVESFQPLSHVKVLVDGADYVSREDAVCDCLDMQDEEQQDICMNSVAEKYDAENMRVALWFADCWAAAGGHNYSSCAFLVEEDGQFKPVDLRTGQPIKHISEYSKVFDG